MTEEAKKKSKRELFNEDPEAYKKDFAERTERKEAEMQLDEHQLNAMEDLVTGVGKPEMEYGEAEIHKDDGSVLWTLKVKASLDGEQEQIYAKIQSETLKENSGKGGDVERVIVNMAKFMASMFPEDTVIVEGDTLGPDAEDFWLEFHRRTNLEKMLEVLEDIMGPYNARMESIKKFRPKSKRRNRRNSL